MAFTYKVFGVLCVAVALTVALPAEEGRSSRNAIHGDSDLVSGIYKECLTSDSMSCVKYKLFSFIDRVMAKRSVIALSEGVTMVKTPEAAAATANEGAPRSLTGDESLEQLILSRVQSFLSTYTIKVDLKGSDIVNAVTSTGRALEDVSENLLENENEEGATGEARGKKKKAAKILGPLLLAVALKAAALLPLLLGAIALIAGKALLIGKIALVLSAIIGLKKLLSQEKHVTYEVVAHPHHSTSHTSSHGDAYALGGSYGGESAGYSASSGHGGWGRSIQDAQDIAYSGQKPT
ncbi:osiris 7 [Anopheles darlingi]|uniref:Osiris 7 n=1 Tax=Anopheles darlingi TaxID=43151 RepID=W5JAM2_ANODA|nr:osiris 7 [Anopheles darlingi]